MMPANERALDLMGNDIVDLTIENESLKNEIFSYDDEGLKESRTKLSNQFDDEKRASLFMSGTEKQMKKYY